MHSCTPPAPNRHQQQQQTLVLVLVLLHERRVTGMAPCVLMKTGGEQARLMRC